MTSPTDERPELLTPGTYVRRFFALLAIRGATVSGQVTTVSPLTFDMLAWPKRATSLGLYVA